MMVPFSLFKKPDFLNRNGIKIYFFTFYCPRTWTELNSTQLLKSLNILSSAQESFRMRILLIFELLSPTTFHRRILKLFLSTIITDYLIYQMLPLMDFLYSPPEILHTQLPKVKNLSCKNFQKITFGEFIIAESHLQKQEKDKLTALFFSDKKDLLRKSMKAANYGSLLLATELAYLTFQKSLQKRFSKVFPKPQEGEEVQKSNKNNWNKVLYQLAGNALEMDKYSELPLLRVLFEIEQKIEQAEEIKSQTR
jgi:hypothetical protein